MIGLLIACAGVAGLLISSILLIISSGVLIALRKRLKNWDWIVLILFAFIGIAGLVHVAILSAPEPHINGPSGEAYNQAMKSFFLIGLSPGGVSLGVLSLLMRKGLVKLKEKFY